MVNKMDDNKAQPRFFELLKGRKRQIIFIVIIVLIIILAIFTTREPEATVRGIEIEEVNPFEIWIMFDLTLEVDNGNIIGGTLNSLEADIYFDDDPVPIGHARTAKKYDIKPLGKSILHVYLTIDRLPPTLTPQKIRAKGTANISVFFITVDENFDKTVFG